MTEREPYSKAPITEAVIDLRVSLPEDSSVDRLIALRSHLPDTYGTGKKIMASSAMIEFRPDEAGPLTETSHTHQGFRFDRNDGKRVLQVTTEGFIFSALAPYDRWETFRSEARSLWNFYREVCHPTQVTRVAVRYINRIDIPLSGTEAKDPIRLEDYLTTHPKIADGLTYNTMSGFFMQVQIPQPDVHSLLVINQTIAPPPTPDVFSVVLDLDLFRTSVWDVSEDDAVWSLLEELRNRKNQAFEASITDQTRRLIQ